MSKELTGYVKIKEKEKYQFIYASKCYDTFFSVYAKFTEEGEKIKEIELFIVNYDGNLNLGFITNNLNPKYVFTIETSLFVPIPISADNKYDIMKIDLSNSNISTTNFSNFFFLRFLFPSLFNNTLFDSEFYTRQRDSREPQRNNLEFGKVADMVDFDARINEIESHVINHKAIGYNCVTSLIEKIDN
ncbi:hypothetical protein [uncultured Tenacibaculum sp.]|uniref:hypothetical protein n=1 Tax=uncultured Tenacibaculum sp. TaxID=174713 RepID=UPI00260B9375|nr:hypothetical protein [uncultured Tenacibaculum sp.]